MDRQKLLRAARSAVKDSVTSGTSGVGQATHGGAGDPDDDVRKPPEVEECVQSVLDDNPDYSESRAYAICNAQHKSAHLALDVLFKEWTGPHTGDEGGTYWVNTDTGEKRYQEQKPQEQGDGEDDGEQSADGDDGVTDDPVDPDDLEDGMEVLVNGKPGTLAAVGDQSVVVQYDDGESETVWIEELSNVGADADDPSDDGEEDELADYQIVSSGVMAQVEDIQPYADNLEAGDTVIVGGDKLDVFKVGNDALGNSKVVLDLESDVPTVLDPEDIDGKISDEQYDIGSYDVSNEAEMKVANGINSGEMNQKGADGFIGARYLYENASSIDNPELLADALYHEIQNRDSVTAVKYMKSHLRALDEDPEQLLAERGYRPEAEPAEEGSPREGTVYENFDSERAKRTAAALAHGKRTQNWAEWNDFLDHMTQDELKESLILAAEQGFWGVNAHEGPLEFEDTDPSEKDADRLLHMTAGIVSRIEEGGYDTVKQAIESIGDNHPKANDLKVHATSFLKNADERKKAHKAWRDDIDSNEAKNWASIQFDEGKSPKQRVDLMAMEHATSTRRISSIGQRAMAWAMRGENDPAVTGYNNKNPIAPIEPTELVKDAIEYNTEAFRREFDPDEDAYGLPKKMKDNINYENGTITVYRGVDSKVTGFSSLGSWTTNLSTAEGFDGQGVMEVEAKPEDIAWSHGVNHDKYASEQEVVLFGEGLASKAKPYSGDMMDTEVLENMAKDDDVMFEIAENNDEVMAALADGVYDPGMFEDSDKDDREAAEEMADKAVDIVKEWVQDPSEQASTMRWRNTDTGEYRYQPDKPEPGEGGDDDGGDEGADTDDDGDFETVEFDDLEVGQEVLIDGEEGTILDLWSLEEDGEPWEQEITWQEEGGGPVHSTWMTDLSSLEGPTPQKDFDDRWTELGGGRVGRVNEFDPQAVEAGKDIIIDGETYEVGAFGLKEGPGGEDYVTVDFGGEKFPVHVDRIEGEVAGDVLEVNGYDVNTEWEARFANAIMTGAWGKQGEDGFLNARDSYLHLGSINNVDLLGDALRAEYETRESVTATKRIESRLRSLGADPEQYKPEPEGDAGAGFVDSDYESWRETYSPDNVTNSKGLYEATAEPGVSAKNMAVQDIEGTDRKAFVTQYASNVINDNANGMDGKYRDEIVCLGEFAKNAGAAGSVVPVAHDKEKGHWTAVKQFGSPDVEAAEVSNMGEEWARKVDADDALDKFGIMLLGGAYDLHMHNVMVSEEGEIGFHDLDHANDGSPHVEPDADSWSSTNKAARTFQDIIVHKDWADIPDELKEAMPDVKDWDDKNHYQRDSWDNKNAIARVMTDRARQQAKRIYEENDGDLSGLMYDPDEGYHNEQEKHNKRIMDNVEAAAKAVMDQ